VVYFISSAPASGFSNCTCGPLTKGLRITGHYWITL
jgi:hypothetical protein